jgi:hypothetical protein
MDDITSETIGAIEQQYTAKKRAKRLGKEEPSPLSTASPVAKKAPAKPRAKKGAAASPSADDATVWDSMLPEGYEQYIPDALTPEQETEYIKAGRDANKINQYYAKFAEVRPPRPHFWTGEDHPEDIAAELGRIRSILNSTGSEQNLKGIIAYSGKGLEYVTHTLNYNPLDLDVRELGSALQYMMRAPDSQNPLQPEIAELSIEYGDWLGSGPESRLLFKLLGFVHTYSQMKKNPQQLEQLFAHQQAQEKEKDGDETKPQKEKVAPKRHAKFNL